MTELLRVHGISAGYDDTNVLFDVDLSVGESEVVTLLGRNGMGKTTTIRCIMGLLRPTGGEILFAGERNIGREPFEIAHAGIGLVPEGRQIFPNLSVRENLVATAFSRAGVTQPWTLDAVLDLFPGLVPRLSTAGGLLSGGEQQMLAIGRTLMINPKLLILDEATEGLAPLVRAEIWRVLARIKDTGLSIIVVDKNLRALTKFADRHYILEKGRTVWGGTSAELLQQTAISERYLGV